jgi:protein phosphatase
MIAAIGRSHPGTVRAANQDAFVSDPELALLVVADGMGGHRGGEVAAAIAVETIHRFVRSSRTDAGITWPVGFDVHASFEANQLCNAIQLAHRRIYDESQRVSDLEGMGSTVVAAIVRNGRVVLANVGDSRLYLFRGRALTQLSVDHSWMASMLSSGADPLSLAEHPMRHMLTQALGSNQRLDLAVRDEPLDDGDVLLLCSDGLYGPVQPDRIAEVLSAGNRTMQDQVDRLVDLANQAGGPDNITAVVARYERSPADTGVGTAHASGARA